MVRTSLQGVVDFSIAHKIQKTWGDQEAITFSLEGIGATLVFLGLVADAPVAMILGLGVLLASGMLLLAHLGAPRNLIYLLANVRHSWMSRGAALIPLFMGLAVILLLLRFAFGLPLEGAVGLGLMGVMLVLTIFVLVKSGLVMTTFVAIPFWTGGLLPVLFALSGLASGLALFALIAGGPATAMAWAGFLVNLALLIMILVYVATMRTAGSAAKVSVQLIGQHHGLLFWGVALGLGTAVPMVAGLYDVLGDGAGSLALLPVIALCRVAGDIALRSVVIKVGVYEKVR